MVRDRRESACYGFWSEAANGVPSQLRKRWMGSRTRPSVARTTKGIWKTNGTGYPST
jgi:hypothetical protein